MVLILNLFFLYSLKINWSCGTIIMLLTPAARILSLHPSEFKKNTSAGGKFCSPLTNLKHVRTGGGKTSRLAHKQHLTRFLRKIDLLTAPVNRSITWFMPKWLKNSHPSVFTSDPMGRCPSFRSSQRILLISSNGFHLSQLQVIR